MTIGLAQKYMEHNLPSIKPHFSYIIDNRYAISLFYSRVHIILEGICSSLMLKLFCASLSAQTLKNGGNVLIPCYPTVSHFILLSLCIHLLYYLVDGSFVGSSI